METVAGRMPDRASPFLEHRARTGIELRTGQGRYRVLDIRHHNCLIEMTDHAALRGYADLYENGELAARCLIVLAKPEGDFLRCDFKRRTVVRNSPPVDFPL